MTARTTRRDPYAAKSPNLQPPPGRAWQELAAVRLTRLSRSSQSTAPSRERSPSCRRARRRRRPRSARMSWCAVEAVHTGRLSHLRRCSSGPIAARRPRPVVCSPRKPRLPCRAAGRAACRAAALSFATVRAYGPRHRCRRRRYRRRPHLNRRTYGRRRPPPSRLHLAASATTITVRLPGAQGARAAGGGRAGVQAHRAGASQAGACRGQVERAPPPAALPRRLCRRHPAAATKAWQVGR